MEKHAPGASARLSSTVAVIAALLVLAGCGDGGNGHRAPMTRCVGDAATGCPFSTIQSAVDASRAGDTVIVHAGTYRENVIVDTRLSLRPAGDGPVTVQALDAYEDVVTVQSAGSGSSLGGLSVFGGRHGIVLSQADDCVITDNVVEHHIEHGIVLRGSDDNEVSGNLVSGVDEGQVVGILLDHSNHNSVTMNEVPYNKLNGIGLTASSGNQVRDNSIAVTDGDGIGLRAANDNRIVDNSIVHSAFTGIVLDQSSRNEVIGNTITDNDGQVAIGIILVGIDGAESNYNRVEENQIERMASYGIVLIHAGNTRISHNRIATAGIHGLAMDIDTSGTAITRNTITDSGVGIRVHDGAVDNAAHENNIVANDLWGVQNDASLPFDAANNYWGPDGPAGQTSGEVIVDPWLTQPVE